MKKPRSDSKLDALPESRVLELRDGLLGGWSYDAAMSWLATECGVSSTLSALSSFFKRHCAPVMREKRQLAALKAEAIGDLAGNVDWDAASIEHLRQMVFEFMADPNADLESTERMFRLLLKSRDQDAALQKIRAAAKSKIEAGLDALFAEIKGNKKAEALFAQLQEVVKAA